MEDGGKTPRGGTRPARERAETAPVAALPKAEVRLKTRLTRPALSLSG